MPAATGGSRRAAAAQRGASAVNAPPTQADTKINVSFDLFNSTEIRACILLNSEILTASEGSFMRSLWRSKFPLPNPLVALP